MSEEQEIQKLKNQLLVKQQEINSLLDVTQAINGYDSIKQLYQIYRFVLQGEMRLTKIAAFVKNGDWSCVIDHGAPKELIDVDVDEVLVPLKDSESLEGVDDERLTDFDHIIHLFDGDKAQAIIVVGGLLGESNETVKEKVNFIKTITNIILVAIDNKRLIEDQIEKEKMEKELELAKQVQSMLIPEKLPNNYRIHMSAFYLPHKEVGGDYYDCLMLNDEELAFCVADISGKGIAAALLMANFQANLRAMLKQNLSLKSLVTNLNESVNKVTKGEKFITFFLAKINLVNNRMVYVNAGHNPPLLCNGEKIKELDEGCTILGMFEQLPNIEVGNVDLQNDSMIFSYTDGLTDVENEEDEMFESERVEAYLCEHHDETPDDFNKNLEAHIREYKGSRAFVDDITFLTCKFTK